VPTASKCDDVSCWEVIRALRLKNDPKLEEIEARIKRHENEIKKYTKLKSEAENILKR